jgi:hypothetical protein
MMIRFLPIVALAVVASACGAPTDEEDQVTSTSAFTVDGGDKFVISATPERVVLAKKVRGVDFPFDASSLRGKAILIHPVRNKAEGGVYLRAHDIEDDIDRLVVTGAPLNFHQMEKIREDEIVRIYIDVARPDAELAFNLPVDGLERSEKPITGVTVSHDIEQAQLAPTPLANWTEEGGLELGLRLDFDWKSKVVARGEGSAEVFRSPTLESAPYVLFVPIGAAVVPITFTASAYVSCKASVSGLFDASFTIDAHATVAGSLRIKDGVEEGPWPATARGTASVTPNFVIKERAKIACSIPRVEVRTAIAGVVGAYIAVAPVATVSSNDLPSFEVGVHAGVDAKVFGLKVGTDTELYTWKPL